MRLTVANKKATDGVIAELTNATRKYGNDIYLSKYVARLLDGGKQLRAQTISSHPLSALASFLLRHV